MRSQADMQLLGTGRRGTKLKKMVGDTNLKVILTTSGKNQGTGSQKYKGAV